MNKSLEVQNSSSFKLLCQGYLLINFEWLKNLINQSNESPLKLFYSVDG